MEKTNLQYFNPNFSIPIFNYVRIVDAFREDYHNVIFFFKLSMVLWT